MAGIESEHRTGCQWGYQFFCLLIGIHLLLIIPIDCDPSSQKFFLPNGRYGRRSDIPASIGINGGRAIGVNPTSTSLLPTATSKLALANEDDDDGGVGIIGEWRLLEQTRNYDVHHHEDRSPSPLLCGIVEDKTLMLRCYNSYSFRLIKPGDVVRPSAV